MPYIRPEAHRGSGSVLILFLKVSSRKVTWVTGVFRRFWYLFTPAPLPKASNWAWAYTPGLPVRPYRHVGRPPPGPSPPPGAVASPKVANIESIREQIETRPCVMAFEHPCYRGGLAAAAAA